MQLAWDALKSQNGLKDVFASREEYECKIRDEHGRFLRAYSKRRNEPQPIVSRYLTAQGLHTRYPGSHKFAVCLTHDVDEVRPPLKHTLASSAYALKSFKFKECGEQLAWKFNGRLISPYKNFPKIMDIEKKYGAKSTFYFMATQSDPVRFRYDIENLKDDLGYIAENGWDIGLHTGYYSYDDPDKVSREKNRLEKTLGKEVIGCRNHYLRFKTPDTWAVLAKAGFKHDSTFGYSDDMGFRNGMCHPFRPINLNTLSTIDIVEIPLNTLDSPFMSTRCTEIKYDTLLEKIKKLICMVEECEGVFTLEWHNYVFSCPF